MKRQLARIAAALMVLFGFALLTTSLRAQSTFVYTNNNLFGPNANSVSAFSVGPDGALIPVAGSPFLTGGSGGLGFTNSQIVVTTLPGNFLYASNNDVNNGVNNSISGFSIDTITGALTPVPGSPFATGVSSAEGIPLAVTPDGQFLYAGNPGSANMSLSAFSIASNGALTPVPGSPFPVGILVVNMKVTPDGKFLAVAQDGVGDGLGVVGLSMFSIGSNGALTTVPGSPFFFSVQGLDVNCASNLLFAPPDFASSGPSHLAGVNVLNIASNGVLTPIAGSPFTSFGNASFADGAQPG